jgi:hypothetical protein
MMPLNKWLYSLRMPGIAVYFLTALLAAAYVLLWNKYRLYNVSLVRVFILQSLS